MSDTTQAARAQVRKAGARHQVSLWHSIRTAQIPHDVTCLASHLGSLPQGRCWCRLIAGGVAGALSRGSVAPLERLRTLMMADSQNRRLNGTPVQVPF